MAEFFIFWIIGWLIWMIGYYIYNVYIDAGNYGNCLTKKLILYRGFTSGVFSWIGILFVIGFGFAYVLSILNDWIENKLS